MMAINRTDTKITIPASKSDVIKMCKKIVEIGLDSYIVPKSKSVQDYINFRNSSLGNYKLVRGMHNCTIKQVIGEYRFYDIRKTDTVLDIGANIGAFSMFVSQSVKQVYAVEPLFADILKMNIDNNNIDNIKIFDIGLGDGWLDCDFMGRSEKIKCESLEEIIKKCDEQVDFLKCDCEGGEWYIKPKELKGIRRIEAEIHSFNNENLLDFSDMLLNCGYNVDITDNDKRTMVIHAYRK